MKKLKLTWVHILIGVVVVVLISTLGYFRFVESNKARALEVLGLDLNEETYMDNVLNFTVRFPTGWAFSLGDEDSIGKIAAVAAQQDSFNLLRHPLEFEVVPIVFFGERGEEGYKIFASLMFRGIVDTKSLEDYVNIMIDDLEIVLKANNHTDIVVVSSNVIDTPTERGFNLLVTAKSGQTVVRYTQISRVLGRNLATVIHGATFEDKDAVAVSERILSSIKPLFR